ncbi:hypothetical protein SHJG_4333 [Streptomyces hygroscopicus subsp. jinggangensis 5008]|nr:hypothetical protein SHJG_4333 [Streptomyces hygroscopicus subsp. jinggangensis 5008]
MHVDQFPNWVRNAHFDGPNDVRGSPCGCRATSRWSEAPLEVG